MCARVVLEARACARMRIEGTYLYVHTRGPERRTAAHPCVGTQTCRVGLQGSPTVMWWLWRDSDRSLMFVLFFECVVLVVGQLFMFVASFVINAATGGDTLQEDTLPRVVTMFAFEGGSLSLLLWAVWRARTSRRSSAERKDMRARLKDRAALRPRRHSWISAADCEFQSVSSAVSSSLSEEPDDADETLVRQQHATLQAQAIATRIEAKAMAIATTASGPPPKRAQDLAAFEEMLDDDAYRDRFTKLLWTQFHAAAFSFCETMRLVLLLTDEGDTAQAQQCLQVSANY